MSNPAMTCSEDRINFSRRTFLLGGIALVAILRHAPSRSTEKPRALILAPSNLGLRPEEEGPEPGTWRAPEVLMAAGLKKSVGADEVVQLPRPPYDTQAQANTRVRNGQTLRQFSLDLGSAVRDAMKRGAFPLVIGGDCSVLLGSLYGARLEKVRGLIHIDGHSDFFHPANHGTRSRLDSAAGMDLALATGRGEPLLTRWPEIDGPLVRDEDAIQLGEREALIENDSDIERTAITRYVIQDVLRAGVDNTAHSVIHRLKARGLDRVWLHVDLDVLDQSVMSAVDSPGSPGLTFAQLSSLIGQLLRSDRVAGATIAIYDPARDPNILYAAPIVTILGEGFSGREQQ